jgi:MFS family permease
MSSQTNRRATLLLVILSGLILSLCMGLRQSLGLFMRPMALELGISAATFGFAIAVQNLIWGLSQPFLGAAADRYGPRPVLIGSALLYTAGLLLMVFSKAVPAGLQIAGFLAGIGTAGTGFGVLIGAVSRATAPEKRSQTVGVVAAAGSLGTMVIAPIGQGLIDNVGWKAALLVFAGIAASMVLFSIPVRGNGPTEANSPTAINFGHALREAMTHRGYLFMTFAFFACGFQLVFLTTHRSVAFPRVSRRARLASSVYAMRLAPMSSESLVRATARSGCLPASICCARCSSCYSSSCRLAPLRRSSSPPQWASCGLASFRLSQG